MCKTLTISVAAYNIEKYIHKMMQSLIDSNCMKDLEILIVDDGSKDNTAKIAKEYETMYPDTVKHVAKENGGHGSTINTGIKLAKGKYFRALDGDDWVNSDNLSGLISTLKEIDVDMIICDYDKCFSDGRIETQRFDGIQPMQIYPFNDAVKYITWMCYHTIVYRTEILQNNHIRLDENCFYVDTEYDLFPIPYIHTLYYYNHPVYCYRLGIDGQSVSPESRKKNISHCFAVAQSLLKLCVEKSGSISEEQKEYIVYGAADHCIWYIRSLLLFPYSFVMQWKIRDFDNMIKEYSTEIYSHMEKHNADSRIIKALRKTGYYAYWLIKTYKGIKHSY